MAFSNNGERESIRPQARPLKRPPPEVKATRRAIRRQLRTRTHRSLRLQNLRTTRMETDSPPTHGRYAHYRGVPIPRSRYCLLETKRTLPQAIIPCREIMRIVRENGRHLCCGRCVDALIVDPMVCAAQGTIDIHPSPFSNETWMVSSTCGRHTNEMRREERCQNCGESWFTFADIRFCSQNGRRLMIV